MISGRQKTGKSASLFSVAERIGASDSGAQVFFFDSESALYDAEAIVAPLIGRGVMVPYQANDYDGFSRFADDVLGRAKDDDWVMVDKADKFWKWSQDEYLVGKTGKTLAEHRKDLVKADKSIAWGGISQVIERSEWAAVNDLYFSVINPLVLSAPDRPKLHLMFVTEVRDMEGEKGEDLRGEYNQGVMPTGQKELPYQMRTLVQLEKQRAAVGTNVRYLLTTSERHGSGRPNLDRIEWSNFAMSYLFNVAKWTTRPAAPPTNSSATQPTTPEKSPEPEGDGSIPSPEPADASTNL